MAARDSHHILICDSKLSARGNPACGYLHEFSSAAAESYPDLVQTFDTMAENLENHTQFFYNASLICEWLDLCLSVVLGVFGNYFYYRFVLRRVKKAREETPDAAVRQNLLRMKGGVNGWLILGMLVLSYVVSCALIFILMLVLFAS